MGIELVSMWIHRTGAYLIDTGGECEPESAVFCRLVAYIWERDRGEPYPIKVLAPECWECDDTLKIPAVILVPEREGCADTLIPFAAVRAVAIPAASLRQRLPEVIRTLEMCSHRDSGEPLPDEVRKIFEDFVASAEEKECATGNPCLVFARYRERTRTLN
jgi:hypothetical protein